MLDEIVWDGARQMPAAALSAEVAAYVEQFTDQVDYSGRAEAVRHFLELVVHESLYLVETTNDHWQVYDSAKTALESYWGESASR